MNNTSAFVNLCECSFQHLLKTLVNTRTNNEQLDLHLTLTKIKKKNSNKCIAHGYFMLVKTLTNV